MADDDNSIMTDWNMSKATLIRIDRALTDFSQAYHYGDWNNMYLSIKRVYLEVDAIMDKDELEKGDKLVDSIRKKYNHAIKAPNEIFPSDLVTELLHFRRYIGKIMQDHSLYLGQKEDWRLGI